MCKRKIKVAASLKQAGAITSHSNSPFVNLSDQHCKYTSDQPQTFRIIRQQYGLNNILNIYISSKQ